MINRDTAIASLKTLQEFLRLSRPAWTNEMPEIEGFYWVRDRKGADIEVVRVRIDYSEPSTPFVVQSGDPAVQGVQYLSDYSGCQWAGPIEQPQP